MPVADTSRAAYSKQREENKTQERELFCFLRDSNAPLSDRQIAEHFHWTPSHAAARRNGMTKKLINTDWECVEIGKEHDRITAKLVKVWTVRKKLIVDEKQDKLF